MEDCTSSQRFIKKKGKTKAPENSPMCQALLLQYPSVQNKRAWLHHPIPFIAGMEEEVHIIIQLHLWWV
jgi:hypothetical protein